MVYSLKKDGIKLSVRSEGVDMDAGKIINKALSGIGSGGGHAAMAGGFITFSGDVREAEILMGGVKERFLEVIIGKTWM